MPENPTQPFTGVVTALDNLNIPAPHTDIEMLAFDLAKKLVISEHPIRQFPIREQLDLLLRAIRAAHDQFEKASRQPHASITPAAEWLLDNF